MLGYLMERYSIPAVRLLVLSERSPHSLEYGLESTGFCKPSQHPIKGILRLLTEVETRGLEPLTYALQRHRSPN